MSFLQNLKFWGRKPPAARPAVVKLGLGRMFAAADDDRLNGAWTTTSESADQLIYRRLRVLRARSREQFYNNDYVRRFVSTLQANIVGPKGIATQSLAAGLDGNSDQLAQQAIERAWSAWQARSLCDLKGRLSWRDIQNQAVATMAVDGEVFVRLHSAGPHGFQLELIDPELCPVDLNAETRDGNTIRLGLEINQAGRVVAYYFQAAAPNTHGGYTTGLNGKDYVRVPAEEVLHVFRPDVVDQKRGLPWTATALQRLKMLAGYENAALVAARVGASKMGFFTTKTGDEYTGDGKDAVGNTITHAEPGAFEELAEGTTFSTYDPAYPAGEFGGFMKQCLRGIAGGLGISYNTLANDLEGVNFSSIRHGAIEDREVFKGLQELLIEQLIEPVFLEWITRQHVLQTIKIPRKDGTPRPLSRPLENYTPASHQGRRWDWVDPLKDITAKAEEVALGASTVSAIIRERGRDPEEVWAERKRELAILAEIGIAPPAGKTNLGASNGSKNDDEL